MMVLELKLPTADSYVRISPTMARALNEERERDEINRLRKDLTARPQPLTLPSTSGANLIPLNQRIPYKQPTTTTINTNLRKLAQGHEQQRAGRSGGMEDIEEADGFVEGTTWGAPPRNE